MGLFDLFCSSPENKLGKLFDFAVKDVVDACNGNSMLAGIMTFHALSVTYDMLKHDSSMIQQSGLSEKEYLQLLDKVLNMKGRKYISNWDQMLNGNRYTD